MITSAWRPALIVMAICVSVTGCSSAQSEPQPSPSATSPSEYPVLPVQTQPIPPYVVGGTELLPRMSVDRSISAGELPGLIVQYQDSGAWGRDIQAIVDKARSFLDRALIRKCGSVSAVKRGACKASVVYDLDDTLISSYPWYKANNFTYNKSLQDFEARCENPTIPQVQAFFNYTQQLGVKNAILTGRREDTRESVMNCLAKDGYSLPFDLILRKADQLEQSAVTYKTTERRKLAAAGYPVVVNIGDQLTDLDGGETQHAYLVPNPMYRLR